MDTMILSQIFEQVLREPYWYRCMLPPVTVRLVLEHDPISIREAITGVDGDEVVLEEERVQALATNMGLEGDTEYQACLEQERVTDVCNRAMRAWLEVLRLLLEHGGRPIVLHGPLPLINQKLKQAWDTVAADMGVSGGNLYAFVTQVYVKVCRQFGDEIGGVGLDFAGVGTLRLVENRLELCALTHPS